MKWTALTAALTIALDQASKIGVVHLMDLKTRGEIAVLDPLLMFRMAWNRGVNFGLGASDGDITRWILIVLALAISAWVLRWVMREKMGRAGQIAAGLLVGGALGNVIDRVAYGAVADFINMSCCGFANPWSFNVADIAIFAGAIGLVLFSGEQKTAK